MASYRELDSSNIDIADHSNYWDLLIFETEEFDSDRVAFLAFGNYFDNGNPETGDPGFSLQWGFIEIWRIKACFWIKPAYVSDYFE